MFAEPHVDDDLRGPGGPGQPVGGVAAAAVGKAAGGSNDAVQGGGVPAVAVRLPALVFKLRATNAAPIRPDPSVAR